MIRTYVDTNVLIRAFRGQDAGLAAAAIVEAGKYTLSAMDALHIAAAQRLHADEFITAEKPDKPLFKIRSPKVIAL